MTNSLSNHFNNLTLTEYTLCYRYNYNSDWRCKTGYKTKEEACAKEKEIAKDTNINTVVFPFNRNIPQSMQRRMIQWELLPNITFHQ